MEYTHEQLAGFKAEFARRQKRQFAVAAVILAGLISMLILRDRAFQSPVGIALVVAAMAAIMVFTLQNWRCPACGKYLGKGAFPRFCPQCGVALK
jgi:hypothetical protein